MRAVLNRTSSTILRGASATSTILSSSSSSSLGCNTISMESISTAEKHLQRRNAKRRSRFMRAVLNRTSSTILRGASATSTILSSSSSSSLGCNTISMESISTAEKHLQAQVDRQRLSGLRCLYSLEGEEAAAAAAGEVFRKAPAAKENVVVILGATGTGKTKLSIDLAVRFNGEVVNVDKIQLYSGLDITTNKVPLADRRGVQHHLLGALDPVADGEVPRGRFRLMADREVAGIAARRRLPVMAGGSNSYVHAALTGFYDPEFDPFSGEYRCRSWRPMEKGPDMLKYRCCFLWVDVEPGVLAEHLDRRVDEMVAEGMVDELERYFAIEGPGAMERHPGLGKAIGVPEFKDYFTKDGMRTPAEYERAVAAIKENTRRLAEVQVGKIRRLAEMGWGLQKVDATAAVVARMAGSEDGKQAMNEAWERDVLKPSLAAVESFMQGGRAGGEEAAVRHHPHVQQLQHQTPKQVRHIRRRSTSSISSSVVAAALKVN